MSRKYIIAILLLSISQLGLSFSAHGGIRTVTSHGQAYVPLGQIARYYTMTYSTPDPSRVRLINKWNTLEFETGSRRCWVNGTLVWLCHPSKKISFQWSLKEDDFNKLIDPLLRPYAYLKGAGSRTVVLDPGHGGKDLGAQSPRKIYEKLLTMNIAKRVRKLLQAQGVTVKLTRSGDQTLTLSQRTQIAAKNKADLFVSLHADSASKTAVGTSAFILARSGCYSTHGYGQGTASSKKNKGNQFDVANAALGFRIQEHYVKSTRQADRGLKHARFQVLREAPCPAVLLEMAFISNPKEEALVLKTSHQDKMARGIANGILAYLSDIRRAR
jgi:N-acetylmuramoyl-L-alanine amidase